MRLPIIPNTVAKSCDKSDSLNALYKLYKKRTNNVHLNAFNFKVTTVLIGHMHAYHIAKLPIPEGFNRTNLQNLFITGERTRQQTMLHLQKVLPKTHITPLYGQTEAGHMTLFNPKNARDKEFRLTKTASCGRPLTDMSYKVVDIETETNVGYYQTGELRVTSGCVMNGYYCKDSSDSFDSEGWLRTGDLVYYDEDFCFFVVGRIKDVLIHKGEHVPPAIVEQVILGHPNVKAAIVFGTPHDIDGDLPTALVVLKNAPSDTKKCAQDIKNYVDERLDEVKRLRGGLEIVEQLHYTPTGKLRRNYIKKMYLSGNTM